MLYDPKTFFTHAALLVQGSPHWRKFPTAASRRSLGRVSVPMWPFTLSGRLRIIALVGRYLTNQLMRRRSIHVHTRRCFNMRKMPPSYLSGFSYRFQQLSRAHGQVTYVLLTRSPLSLFGSKLPKDFVRLACIRHAASVHPEPGSNSPFDLALRCLWHLSFIYLFVCFEIDVLVCIFISCSVFKDHLHLSSARLYYQIISIL